MREARMLVAGADVGTECVKVVILDGERRVIGRATTAVRGYFEDCIQEAMANALEEAHASSGELAATCSTGFGASCGGMTSLTATEAVCHARGAFHHLRQAMTVVDVGGREPKVIHVDAEGCMLASRNARKCAVGIGTFLMFAARHLDVHPTRLMDLAASVESPARVGGYCSVFAEVEVIELLRRGVPAGEIALGCMHAIAERIIEMGGLNEPLALTGGVCVYFPGVVTALAKKLGVEVRVTPEPILAGAMGAALFALESVGL